MFKNKAFQPVDPLDQMVDGVAPNYHYNGQEAHVHEWADHYISLSMYDGTRSVDLLIAPTLLTPYARVEAQQIQRVENGVPATTTTVVKRPVYKPGQPGQTTKSKVIDGFEQHVITEPVLDIVRVDTTPMPTVIGRPVTVGSEVKVLRGGKVMAQGRLCALGAYALVGFERFYFVNNFVVQRVK